VTRAEVSEFMSHVPSSVVVVFDESYYDFVEDTEYSNSFDYISADTRMLLRYGAFPRATVLPICASAMP